MDYLCCFQHKYSKIWDDSRYTRDTLSCPIHIILRCNWRSRPPPCAFFWSTWHCHTWPCSTAIHLPSVSATDRLPTLGLPRPNCHSHVFSLYTFLPRDSSSSMHCSMSASIASWTERQGCLPTSTWPDLYRRNRQNHARAGATCSGHHV